jgi:hypothetical protein
MAPAAAAVVVVVDGALTDEHAAAAAAGPAAFLKVWTDRGVYTAGRTYQRNAISQWGAHLSRLRRSLVALRDAASGGRVRGQCVRADRYTTSRSEPPRSG